MAEFVMESVKTLIGAQIANAVKESVGVMVLTTDDGTRFVISAATTASGVPSLVLEMEKFSKQDRKKAASLYNDWCQENEGLSNFIPFSTLSENIQLNWLKRAAELNAKE